MSRIAEQRSVKYIFIDIVAYSENRSAEAQTDIIAELNTLVKKVVGVVITNKEIIYIPTGDGICIAIIDSTVHYEAPIKVALALLESINAYNHITLDNSRNFEVRIGLNENVDNIITDINERINVAGAGINIAQRVMSLGDGGTLLISDSLYNTLRHREAYAGKLKPYTAIVKHDLELQVYQYVDSTTKGLWIEKPLKLRESEDSIDAALRRCLTNKHKLIERHGCFYTALEAWRTAFNTEFGAPPDGLTQEQIKTLGSLVQNGRALLKFYQEFISQIYNSMTGTEWKVDSVEKCMNLDKAFVLEMRWLESLVQEAIDNQREP